MDPLAPWIDALRYLNAAIFTALALVSIAFLRKGRGGSAAIWLFATFATLALVTLAGLLLPERSDSAALEWVRKVNVAVLALFPFLLYRFAASFAAPAFAVKVITGVFTAVITVWTLALPSIPERGEQRPDWFVAYLLAFLLHWTVMSIIVAVQLWRGGSGQPRVVRSRMRLMAAGAVLLTIGLLAAGASRGDEVRLATQVVALVSGLAFFVGFAPPKLLKAYWRLPEQEAMRQAVVALLEFSSPQELQQRFLPIVARIVGGRGAGLLNADGEPVVHHGVTPADLADARRALRDGATDSDGGWVRLALPDGALFVWTSRFTPFFGEDEVALLHSLAVVVELALERQRNIAELQDRERRLKNTTHQLELANEQLKQADRLKSEFLSMAAHELRTPLTAITGFTSTMQNMWDELPDGEKQKFVGIIDAQGMRLARLVDDLLTLSRIEGGVLNVNPAPSNVALSIKQTIRELGVQDVQVSCDDEIAALVDADHLQQILVNYVSNAMKYGEQPIEVRATAQNGEVHVAVCDSGRGVPPDFVPRLFERFTRAADDAAEHVGTGLGLSIVKGLAQAHGGDAWYEPREPQGSCFCVSLPRAA